MSKKTKVILILNIIAIFIGAFFLVQQLFFEKEPNLKLILESATLFLFYSAGVTRYVFLRVRAHRNILFHQYFPLLVGAFCKDKKRFQSLLSIGRLINKGEFDKAYDRLERLKTECKTSIDRIALLLLEALCLNGKMNYGAALSVLEKITAEDSTHSSALAFQALLFQRMALHSQAKESLLRAKERNKSNPAVHICDAIYHLNREDYASASASAKVALELDFTSNLARFIAYKSNHAMGLEDVAVSYLDSIKKHGENVKEVEQQLETFLI